MQTRYAIRSTGAPATSLGARHYRKEILRAGEEWIHPATGQRVAFTAPELQAIAAESNRWAASQDQKVPFPDGHTFDAKSNLGFWRGFSVEGDRLYGLVEAGDDQVAAALGGRIRDVSAWIESGMRDSKGNVYGPAIRHVCATPEPVIHSSNFVPVALSRDGVTVPVFVPARPEETTVKPKLISLLALAATATDDEIVAALEKRLAAPAPTPPPAEVTALTARATAAETANVALSARLQALEADAAKRDQAELDQEVGAVKALAASSGRPESFGAEREKLVRNLWTKDRAAAKDVLAFAKEAIGAPAQVGGTPVKPPAAPDATAEKKAATEQVVLALSRNGHRVETSPDGLSYRLEGGSWLRLS